MNQEGRSEKETKAPSEKPLQEGEPFRLAPIATEVGFSVAIPIVILALLGRLADRHFGTAPFLLLAGIALSVIISSALVWMKMKKYLR